MQIGLIYTLILKPSLSRITFIITFIDSTELIIIYIELVEKKAIIASNFLFLKISIKAVLTVFCYIYWRLDGMVYNKTRMSNTKLELQCVRGIST